jgi:NTE family protein
MTYKSFITMMVAGLALAETAAPVSARQDSAPAPATAALQAQSSSRPKVGLALGGGAARGIAHIGLLRWFEENRIPIDAIAGTSMGGLIGGAYASGLSPDEIQTLMKEADWDLMFLADSPFRYKTFRRKEDARAFPAQIDFGLKGGFKLPSGLNAGQQIELLLDRISLPYYELRDFDDLPTPFRCVATDIRKDEPLVLGSGSFSQALRATMAIPAVFTPVVLDERVLVDGGAVNNVPADVVKAMGADVAIAVNVGSGTDEAPVPTTLFAILGQTIDSMMTTGTRLALKSADIVVVPDLKGLTGTDWRRVDDLVAQGYKAAAAMSDQLLRYQVDEAAYAEWMRARTSRRKTETPVVARVTVEGLPPAEAKQIASAVQAAHVGRPVAREELENTVLLIAGSDRYELIAYSMRSAADGGELVLNVRPKSYGPPFLLPALDVQNIDSNSFAISLRLRVAVYDTPLRNSELRFDVGVGSDQQVGIELYKRLGHRGFFVAPRAYFEHDSLNGYDSDGELVAEYRVKTFGAGLDVGHTTGMRSEIRFGYDEADVRARLRVGVPTLPEANGSDRRVSLRWTFDGQNSPLVPSRGVYLRTALRYFIDTPAIVDTDDNELLHPRDVTQGEARVSWFKRIRPRQRLFVSGGAGTSFGDDPGFNQFRLGGPGRLGAFNNDQIRGENYVLGVGGLLHEWFRLPDVIGANAYFGGWLEQGSAFNAWNDAEYKAAASVGVVLETILGPAFLGFSQSLTDGNNRFYLALGPFLR